jgi:hypothetical protein
MLGHMTLGLIMLIAIWGCGNIYQRKQLNNCHPNIQSINGTSILLISDVHVFGDSDGSWFKSMSNDMYMNSLLRNVRNIVNRDYTFHLGDAMEEGHDSFTTQSQYRSYAHRFRMVTQKIDINTVGNHDIGWPTIDSTKLEYYNEYIGPDTGNITLQVNNKPMTFAYINTMYNTPISCPDTDVILSHYYNWNAVELCPQAKRIFLWSFTSV